VRWRTSSYSTGNGECVEVGDGGGLIAVRDSRDLAGPVVTFTPAVWTPFAARVKRGA
jgi:hypothetical protein